MPLEQAWRGEVTGLHSVETQTDLSKSGGHAEQNTYLNLLVLRCMK